MKKEEPIPSSHKNSNILILYDDLLISNTELISSLNNIFSVIQSNNIASKTELFHDKDTNSFKLNNKYYSCNLIYRIEPISTIKDVKINEYEGIILFLNQVSIKNKTFNDLSNLINEEDTYSSCVVLFNENRDIIENSPGYMELIEATLEKHFEIICDCGNPKSFNAEDGPGALSMSLHSANWKNCNLNNNNDTSNKLTNIPNISTVSKEDKKIKENKKKGYDLMNDQEEIDKMFNKIKEMKLINTQPGISDEERRANAEKAILMMAEMFGLDEEEEEEDDN